LSMQVPDSLTTNSIISDQTIVSIGFNSLTIDFIYYPIKY